MIDGCYSFIDPYTEHLGYLAHLKKKELTTSTTSLLIPLSPEHPQPSPL
jgi:hypothetical protein